MNIIITAILFPVIIFYLYVGLLVAKLDSYIDNIGMAALAIFLWPVFLLIRISLNILEWCIE